MKQIKIDSHIIPYQVTKKNNKNTYFYFKKDGYIQINLSRYQKEEDAIKFIMNNPTKFIKKLHSKPQLDNSVYYLFDTSFQKEEGDFQIDYVNRIIYTKPDSLKQKQYEKNVMLDYLQELIIKHQHNPYINIDNVTLKTRYMTSRHGSCNTRKRIININLNLIHYPKQYTEYVFLHEITHLKHPNHQKEFYDTFVKLCPDYKQLKKELKYINR